MINVKAVTYGYDKNSVLKELSFQEGQPIITGLWGRNGAGKTTLMSLLAGHHRPDNGTIQIMGGKSLQQYKCKAATFVIFKKTIHSIENGRLKICVDSEDIFILIGIRV
ncbi:ATP-binding cassette domain-containing protein [Bacillus carboniphilus]|uniref:ATP-binding cassette domain-containing protein n=1 Tax=Bacillus carboniphilus TaxID=86663 RepID=A0ABY9JTR0_9BACI|nr:ATP-binding cassette domain-containing protein [Bacillus carboniphilus]WLR41820.1 ATP-binding cassette domain-containing protein [Bacillus carboniphilus]